jgi:hypothetical protein
MIEKKIAAHSLDNSKLLVDESMDQKGKFLSRQVVSSGVMSNMSSMKDLKSKLISDRV